MKNVKQSCTNGRDSFTITEIIQGLDLLIDIGKMAKKLQFLIAFIAVHSWI